MISIVVAIKAALFLYSPTQPTLRLLNRPYSEATSKKFRALLATAALQNKYARFSSWLQLINRFSAFGNFTCRCVQKKIVLPK